MFARIVCISAWCSVDWHNAKHKYAISQSTRNRAAAKCQQPNTHTAHIHQHIRNENARARKATTSNDTAARCRRVAENTSCTNTNMRTCVPRTALSRQDDLAALTGLTHGCQHGAMLRGRVRTCAASRQTVSTILRAVRAAITTEIHKQHSTKHTILILIPR